MTSLYLPLHDKSWPCTGSERYAGWALRLITLQRGAKGSDVVCQMEHTFIGSARNSYGALSYVWGDPQKSEFVNVNGYRIPITKSLLETLMHLRTETSDRQLWIDALCINQSDIGELSIQVQRMGAIYEEASEVVVFLGPEAEDSSRAIGLLGHLGSLACGNHAAIRVSLEDSSIMPRWHALLKLFGRPWWTRVWIVQEFAVARNVLFICGFLELTGQIFGQALENLVDYRFKAVVAKEHEYLIRHVAKTPIHHLWSTRCIYRDRAKQSDLRALNVLYKFRGSQCSDPRDKIYAMWSLIEKDPLLTPDYFRNTTDVYQSVVQATIESSGTLEVLTHHNRSMKSALNLPTWCPDWTIMRGKRILLWPNRYSACGKLERAYSKVGNNVLTLKGKEVAQIVQLSPFESDDFKNKPFIRLALKDLEKQATQCPYPEKDMSQRLSTFHQTMVAARIRPIGPQGQSASISPAAADEMWDAWCVAPDVVKLPEDRGAKLYDEALYSALCGRSVLFTKSGHLGLVDSNAQVGDRLFVFLGAQVLFCIRDISGLGTQIFEFVGEW